MRGGRSLRAVIGIILSRRTNKGVKTKNIFLINRKINYIADMSQIEELRAFVLIVETGSLTQAADRMGIAVSAVSRRLRDLELRLGTALIQRSTRRLFLNETGQLFYQRAKTVLSTLEDAEQEVQNAGGALVAFCGSVFRCHLGLRICRQRSRNLCTPILIFTSRWI